MGLRHRPHVGLPAGALALALVACSADGLTLADDDPPVPLLPGESRTVVLRHLRFEVKDYEKALTLEQVRSLPRRVLEDVWLFDLELGPLVDDTLGKIREMPREDVEALEPAARNMHRLLTMTPDNAVLEGTRLERMVANAATIGIPPARALADLMQIGVTEDFVPRAIISEVIAEQLIGSHPNARMRRGLVDAEHPDGLYPVAPRSIPITLADVVTNFETLAARFGPAGEHPGFVLDTSGVSVLADDFVAVSKIDVNALPWKGVDLSIAAVASVSSVPAQIETIHDFDDPEWLRVEGVAYEPTIAELTVVVHESERFIAGGQSRTPAGQGNSEAWTLPPWEFEAILIETARRFVSGLEPHCSSYSVGTGAEVFRACLEEDGWAVLTTFADIGDPPPPAYFWDYDLELGQVRLHDGGVAEGEANAAFTLRDVSAGITAPELIERMRVNLEANPAALREYSSLLADNAEGAADFYYVRSEGEEDWLFFVAEYDLELDADGDPVRPYAYPEPGFFGDCERRRKLSSTIEIDGDIDHEKIRVDVGDAMFVVDDAGVCFRVEVARKPSRARIELEVTRMPA